MTFNLFLLFSYWLLGHPHLYIVNFIYKIIPPPKNFDDIPDYFNMLPCYI